jgi:hypothetical protein
MRANPATPPMTPPTMPPIFESPPFGIVSPPSSPPLPRSGPIKPAAASPVGAAVVLAGDCPAGRPFAVDAVSEGEPG